ncbi:MAG: hypothetical protein F2520_02055 [Actinobacteria bacterium]|uniref:Unannotated protein n=1 Tax=freshwater metagenome TaxID=449393 RepID=A0A6J5YE41_9ZZZZ|nr:hypothetical protein [Actinomycetota bacterium]MTA77028.1 hypothetical protein [Actinomycetota bacterium]
MELPDQEPSILEISTPDTEWRFDREFLESNWTCIWGRGCLGILDEPAEQLNQGCCSVGAEFGDEEEAMFISAMAAMLSPSIFQFAGAAMEGGIFSDDRRINTRVVDGACIFLNRPGFKGGEGCALHIAAGEAGESPLDWKPSVCWQLPIRVDWEQLENGRERATLRRWKRADWGDEGPTMAWCCTEGERAYVGESRVVDSLADELSAITGTEVFVELRRRLSD